MSTDFQDLVDDFDRLVQKSEDLSGTDLRANRREQTRVEKLIASITEHGMYNYSGEYAECRDIGHKWDERYSHWEGNELSRMLHCDNCGSERYDVYSRTASLINRRYEYSDGYLLDNADEDISDIGGRLRRYWRAVNIQRAIANP